MSTIVLGRDDFIIVQFFGVLELTGVVQVLRKGIVRNAVGDDLHIFRLFPAPYGEEQVLEILSGGLELPLHKDARFWLEAQNVHLLALKLEVDQPTRLPGPFSLAVGEPQLRWLSSYPRRAPLLYQQGPYEKLLMQRSVFRLA